jgi:hypothetical protein
MAFSTEGLQKLKDELCTVPGKHFGLMQAFLGRNFANGDAREYAQHGFMRRLKTMARSIANTFELLPPELREPPARDLLHDAEIQIQAFVFNAFAATDNLGWILVKEHGLKLPNGADIPKERIGLRPGNVAVRGAVSPEFRAYLETREEWFRHMEDFRHSLAHRVPLYIPPFCVDPRNESAYNDLERRKMQAAQQGRFMDFERLSAEQDRLGFFQPWMVHSVRHDPRPMYFHPQLLADFNTVHEMAEKTLEELARA